MDIQLEKKKGIQKKHIPYIVGGAVVILLLIWIIFGNHASTLRVDAASLNIADVTFGKFNDYIRLNGQVQPISVVQLSPEEGGIVQEKVVEEGAHVKKGDVILRLSNSNLDLQILNAESELAEKQNLLRNTQVTMQQDKLNNETEKVQLDIDTRRKQRTYLQYERLYKERLISREEYLQAKEDYEVAQKKHGLITERLVQDSIYRNIQMDQMEDNLQNMRKNVLLFVFTCGNRIIKCGFHFLRRTRRLEVDVQQGDTHVIRTNRLFQLTLGIATNDGTPFGQDTVHRVFTNNATQRAVGCLTQAVVSAGHAKQIAFRVGHAVLYVHLNAHDVFV